MPAALIDPTVHAAGPLGQSPSAGIMQGIIAQQAQMYPNAQEAQDIRYKNAATQKLDMENSAPGDLGQLFQNALAPIQNDAAPIVQGGSSPNVQGSPQPMTREQMVQQQLPKMAETLARAGQYGQIANVYRGLMSNAPGVQAVGPDPQHPSAVSMSMMGAGDAYTSTPDASLTGATPGQRDRNAKIASIVSNNPGIDPKRAANIVDGVYEYPQDPLTKNMFEVNKASGTSNMLRSPAQGSGSTMPTAAAAQPTSSAASAIGTTLGLEGGYAPTDGASGAPVIFGVNQKWFPQDYARIKQIADTQGPEAGKAAAGQFYKANFWDANHLDNLDPKVAGIVFDGLVNHSQPFGQSLLAAADAGATPEMLLKMRAKEYQRLATVNPDKYAAELPGWQNRLRTLAGTPSGGGQSQPSGAGVSPTAAPTATPFSLKPGDLGIPFGSVYGGGGTVGRVTNGISALLGSDGNGAGSATDTLSTLNNIKNQLIQIKSLQPGMRTNVNAQNRFAQQFPATDPQLLDAENMASGATMKPGEAENMINKGLMGAVQDRVEDAKLLASPDTGIEERQAAQMRVDKTDKLFASLPKNVKDMYLTATGQAAQPEAAVEPKTNLQQGTAATTVPAYKNIPGKPSVTDGDIAKTASEMKMTPAEVVAKLRAAGRVE